MDRGWRQGGGEREGGGGGEGGGGADEAAGGAGRCRRAASPAHAGAARQRLRRPAGARPGAARCRPVPPVPGPVQPGAVRRCPAGRDASPAAESVPWTPVRILRDHLTLGAHAATSHQVLCQLLVTPQAGGDAAATVQRLQDPCSGEVPAVLPRASCMEASQDEPWGEGEEDAMLAEPGGSHGPPGAQLQPGPEQDPLVQTCLLRDLEMGPLAQTQTLRDFEQARGGRRGSGFTARLSPPSLLRPFLK
ncbi:uncharacterized protein LOC135996729 [Caloenas nicobarica]|uniref:uncharacterized protein LOC135996729 n=1 Tax=Caloenas nicobarica TaxID=187106 RepID=UPI0032B84D52